MKIKNLSEYYNEYESDQGCFGLCWNSRYIEWYGCREEFHDAYFDNKNKSTFYYYAANASITRRYIKYIEKVLKLKPHQKCKIYRTTRKNILYISLSDWWSGRIKWSFFTILLRNSDCYYKHWSKTEKNNCHKDLVNYRQYMKNGLVKYATNRFLKGYTKIHWTPGRWFDGWVINFSACQNKEAINKILVKP